MEEIISYTSYLLFAPISECKFFISKNIFPEYNFTFRNRCSESLKEVQEVTLEVQEATAKLHVLESKSKRPRQGTISLSRQN